MLKKILITLSKEHLGKLRVNSFAYLQSENVRENKQKAKLFAKYFAERKIK